MRLDLLDLVFRLERSFAVRIIRTVTGSLRLYDSAFDPPAVVKKKSRTHAWQDPWGGHDDGPSPGGISVLSGSPVTTWSTLPLTTRSQTEYDLRLSPDSPVIVGRSDGWSPEYLDPAYRPTRMVPGTGQAVLHSGGNGTDHCVSRAHFMLLGVSRDTLRQRCSSAGRGNSTTAQRDAVGRAERRVLSPGEKYQIESGTAMVVQLPNGTELRIDANSCA